MKFNDIEKGKPTTETVRVAGRQAGKSIFKTALERMASIFPKPAENDLEDAPLYYPVCSNYYGMDADQRRAYRVREAKRREAEAAKPSILDCPSAKRDAAKRAAEQEERKARDARLARLNSVLSLSLTMTVSLSRSA